ncbi:hypothetical protein HMPREF9456_02054, partial [Dysgonomonas mossii DSM 22836]
KALGVGADIILAMIGQNMIHQKTLNLNKTLKLLKRLTNHQILYSK